jgi:hypothetical protein
MAGWQYVAFDARTITKIRFGFYNSSYTVYPTVNLYEVDVGIGGGLYYYNVANPSAVALYDTYMIGEASFTNAVTLGDYVYLACDAGADVNKIVVVHVVTPANIHRETAVGGAGSTNYTGSDALFLANGYLANVGTGTSAAYYSVSFWSLAAPALPTRTTVTSNISGDLDAACYSGGLIVGVDVDNSKLRVLTAEGTAWTMSVRFYNAADVLLDTIEVYDGEVNVPVTTDAWCHFVATITIEDIPQTATQLDVLLETNTGADAVYVDALSILNE